MKDFVLFIQGANERMIDLHDIARRQSYFVLATQSAKPITMQKFFSDYWPLPIDKDKVIEESLLQKYERLKDAGRVTN